MKARSLSRNVAGVASSCAIAVLLAHCGELPPPGGPQAASLEPAVREAQAERSWMLREAKSETLLYAFGGNDAIYVYDYRPPYKQVGYLAGEWSENMCSDGKGNVFFTQPGVGSSTSYIVEFAHGGTSPIAKLADTNGRAYSCAFDSTTGDLAVVNQCQGYDYEGGCSGQGSIDIYRHERKGPAQYVAPFISWYYYASYDGSGKLYIDGYNFNKPNNPVYAAQEVVAELNKDGTFKYMLLDRPLTSVGGVQWDGSNLIVGDFIAYAIDRFHVSGSNATLIGTTHLDDGFEGNLIVNEHQVLVDDTHAITIYRFPKGQSPIREFSVGPFGPLGFTLSPPPGT